MGTLHTTTETTRPMSAGRRAARTALATALTAAMTLAGCGGEPSTAPDPNAARTLYDRAVVAEMSGDTLGAEDLLFDLASRHPDTAHGRAARARLSSSGSLPATAGILAAVAIPAFMKYVRQSRTSEATMNLRRLADSAAAYHGMERADASGRILPPGLPASAPPSPARPHCGADGESAFDPQPGDWDHPTWQALNFAIVEPHNYQYSFTVEGEGAGATFVARAVGDLNCDGVLSTFEIRGRVDGDGALVSDPMSTENELE